MKKTLGVILLNAFVSGCGGGGGDDAPTPVPDALPGGIWRGEDSISGLEIIGLISEEGRLHFLREDGAQFVGDVSTSENEISGDFEGFTQFGTTFPDGSVHGTGSLEGTVSERNSITADVEFTTDDGEESSGELELSFDSLYNRDSSISMVSGQWAEAGTGDVINIDSGGTFFFQDAETGCLLNGELDVIDADYNAYDVSYNYESCQGEAAVLNGLQFRGLGTLDNTVNPEQAIIGVTASSGSTRIALVLTLSRI